MGICEHEPTDHIGTAAYEKYQELLVMLLDQGVAVVTMYAIGKDKKPFALMNANLSDQECDFIGESISWALEAIDFVNQ